MVVHNKQVSLLDCGLACTKTMLSAYNVDYSDIDKFFDVNTTQGMSLYDIENVLKGFGIESNSYELDDYSLLKTIIFPSIVVVNINSMPHYMVLLNYEKNIFTISDPSKLSITKLNFEELIKIFSGIVLIPESDKISNVDVLKVKNKEIDSTLYDLFIKEISILQKVVIFILGILKVLLPIMMTLILQYMMLNFGDTGLNNQILVPIIVLFSLLIFISISIIDTRLKSKIENKFLWITLKEYYTLKIENFSDDKNNEYILGYFWNLLNSASGIIQKFYLKIYLVMFAIILSTLVYFNYVFSILIIIFLYILFRYNKNKLVDIEATERNFIENSSNFTYLIESSIEGLYDIASFSKEQEFNTEFDKRISNLLTTKFKSAEVSNKILISINVFNIFLGIAFMLSQYFVNKEYKIIDYSNSMLIILLLSTVLQPLLTTWVAFKKSKYSLDFISLKEEIEISTLEKLDLEKIRKINMFNLQVFRKDKLIFENLNITLKSGKIYQILGDNGTGKTTLLKILQGLITPSEGEILINDKKIITLENTDIRDYISVYSTDFHVFAGSLENNIKFDLFSNSESLSYSINEFVGLPNNYQISQRGSNISSGQKQKILLLRALYNDRDIYLFDEPTSNLDVNSRKIFYSELEKLKNNGKIICIVTHDKEVESIIDEVIEL